jgi:MFS family permease
MSSRAKHLLLPLVYLGFASLGLPDGTLGVAWPQLHAGLALSIGMAGALALVSTLLSAVSSFHSGAIVARFDTGPVVVGSCALTAIAMLVMAAANGPAALLLASVLLGSGGGVVDAGVNGYVARHYSGRHMNWLHACWASAPPAGPCS